MLRNHHFYYSLALIFIFSCTSTPPSAQVEFSAEEVSSRRNLYSNMRKANLLTIVYSDAERYQPMVDSIAKNPRFNLEVEGKLASELNLNDLKSGAYFIIGTPEQNELIAALSDQLPVSFTSSGFTFDQKTYTDPEDVFKLYLYPNPLNPAFPIYLITGNSEAAIYNMLQRKHADDWSSLMWASWGYEVYKGNTLNLLGYFSDTTWVMDKTVHFDFSNSADTIGQTPHFTFIGHDQIYEDEAILPIMKQCEAGYENIRAFLEKDIDQRISYNIYPSIEQKGLMLSNTDPAHADFNQKAVYAVINDNFKGQQWQKENEVILRTLLNRPQKFVLEKGLSIYFSGQWQQKGYAYWVNRLYYSNNLPSLSELLDNDVWRHESELVMGTAAASLVDFLIQLWGKEVFLKQYSNWNPNIKEIRYLEAQWHEKLRQSPSLKPSKEKDLAFLKGFNFAHEGYRIYNGYGSQLAKASLEKLKSLGANAIAIVPYSYMRNPEKPSSIPIIQDAGAETDESVIFAHREAQKMGMYTLLKPQIWLGRSWPGEVSMNSEEDWNAFFDYYYRWIRHYALLAEIHDIDGLSLGVEFAKATIQRPDDWKRLLRKIKDLYSGHITYSANWGDEFEQFSFWDEFDYIGLNCYYPLSKEEEPKKETLKKTFRSIAEKIEKVSRQYDKPIVFTEIGFRSVDRTWENPHEDSKGRNYNEHCQNLCYEVVFEEIADKDWCKGILWWKWPSYMDYSKRNATSFTPSSKKAEDTVAKWFEKL